jgi:hypothetical protein
MGIIFNNYNDIVFNYYKGPFCYVALKASLNYIVGISFPFIIVI